MIQRTLILAKPDSFAAAKVGTIISHFETAGLKLLGLKKVRLTLAEAQQFYAVHQERSFFPELTTWMASGPIVAMAWEGENAVARAREILGATNPKEAAKGTLREKLGKSIQENAVHGSDSPENGAIELAFFFSQRDLIG